MESTSMFDLSKPYMVLDIETNKPSDDDFKAWGNMVIDEIKCAVLLVVYPAEGIEETFVYDRLDSPSMAEALYNAVKYFNENHGIKVLVGHNIIRFDSDVLKHMDVPCDLTLGGKITLHDTLLMSKIIEYSRYEHSLESYSGQFSIPKRDLTDLLARCNDDVRLTDKLYKYLVARKDIIRIPDNPFKVEFKVAEIIADQCRCGIPFDYKAACALREAIRNRMELLASDFYLNDPSYLTWSGIPKMPTKQFTKSGEVSHAMLTWIGKMGYDLIKHTPLGCAPVYEVVRKGEESGIVYGYSVSGLPHCLPLTLPPFPRKIVPDLNSPTQVKEYLLSLGWTPTIFNYVIDKDGTKRKTSPKMFDDNKELCPNLELLAEKVPAIKLLKDYFSLKNRAGVLDGWLSNSRAVTHGYLTPDADTIGAITGRFTHRVVANIPRVTSLLGEEFRSLFATKLVIDRFVGWDASSLEARMEAHYTYDYDDGAYARELLEGDIHTKNQHALGLPSRDKAKTFKYAVTYGASAPKLASSLGLDILAAKEAYDQFWKSNESLKKLVDTVKSSAKKKGWIRGLDGRPIRVDSDHSALNRLLQSAGAITMKYAMVLAHRMAQKEGIAGWGVIRYHDEEQWVTTEEDAERMGQIGVKSIELAGKYLGLKVPLTGEYKVGKNWAQTH